MCSWSGDRTAIYSKSLDFTCTEKRRRQKQSDESEVFLKRTETAIITAPLR